MISRGAGLRVDMRRESLRARAHAAVEAAGRHPRARLLSPAIGLAMLGLLAWQVAHIGWDTLGAVIPSSPLFYLVFVGAYLVPVAAELLIYRRLWGVRLADAPIFLRKRVMNDAVLGYSGEAYFCLWAAARGPLRHSALGAVKDVNILSAVAGNLATLALVGATLALVDGQRLATAAAGLTGPWLWGALGVMAAMVAVLLLKPRLFSLPRRELWAIALIHGLRVALGVALVVLAWHLALPAVAPALWLALAAWRAFIARLPMAPNKELLFVNLAILALGETGREVAALLALTAAMTLLAHLLIAAVGALPRLQPQWKRTTA